jgi:radical SAM superfamily enzyme YgiQ (UPF0313 family)
MKPIIYFADLTHTASGYNAPTFPIGSAYVLAYAKKTLGGDFDYRLFKFPEQLASAIVERPPVILALSNFSWNCELAYKINCWAKKNNPRLISIFGGLNFPIVAEEKLEFLKQNSTIDFYIEIEGEYGFSNLVQEILEYDLDIDKLKAQAGPLNNCSYLLNGQLVSGPTERIQKLDEIPSPYLTGILDEFFEYPLDPIIQTTRGCPFSCAFCIDGREISNKVKRFDSNRVREELNYISDKVKYTDKLKLADLNFGMYAEDETTSKYIAELQKRKGWPTFVEMAAGKNNPDRIIKVAKHLKGSWPMTSSIQSSDPDVLRNIKRSNISVDAYKELVDFSVEMDKDAMSYTEIILALPGDTKEKHFESLRYAIANNFNTIRMFQAILLPGTEMETSATRDTFQLQTRFRTIPGSIGVYKFGDENIPVAEIEEIIVGGKDMSFDDYISCRVMNLLVETYFNNAMFSELFLVMRASGVDVFDILVYLHEHTELYTTAISEIISKFISMTKEDLYDSRKEAENVLHNSDVIQKHLDNELGINELLACKTDLYLIFDDINNLIFRAAKNIIADNNKLSVETEMFLDQLCLFIGCRKKEFYKYEDEIEMTFDFDFKEIDINGYDIDLNNIYDFRCQKKSLRFHHTHFQQKIIKNMINVNINTPVGMGRVIHKSNLAKMYRHFDYSTVQV